MLLGTDISTISIFFHLIFVVPSMFICFAVGGREWEGSAPPAAVAARGGAAPSFYDDDQARASSGPSLSISVAGTPWSRNLPPSPIRSASRSRKRQRWVSLGILVKLQIICIFVALCSMKLFRSVLIHYCIHWFLVLQSECSIIDFVETNFAQAPKHFFSLLVELWTHCCMHRFLVLQSICWFSWNNFAKHWNIVLR